MESDRRINLGIVIIASILILAGISFMPDVQAREGYIMNLLLQSLHDVQITNPINGQVLTYQNGFWINANGGGSGESTECFNMASQYQIIVNSTDGNCYVRALANGDNIIISQNATHLIINATGTESTVCSNSAISGFTLIQSSTGGNCVFKKLRAGTGISLSSNSTHITITNSLPEQGCTNAGGTTLLKTGSTCDFKGLTAGTGITVTSGTNTNTIDSSCNNTGSGEAICESANNINSLIATTPLSVSDTTGDLTIACSTCLTTTNSFVQVCTDTASNADTSIGCQVDTEYNFYRVTVYLQTQTSNAGWGVQFNGDSGNNYANRYQPNLSGATTTNSAVSMIRMDGAISVGRGLLFDFVVNNANTNNEHGLVGSMTAIGTGTTMEDQYLFAGHWNNNNSVNTITVARWTGTGTLTTDSYMVVYGYD